jgi:hypothetical protein
MKVSELIVLLNKFPANSTVEVEGCDCVGEADGVDIENDVVLITRSGGVRQDSRSERWAQ